MRTREIRFYDLVNIFKYHTNFNDKFINVYSFSLQQRINLLVLVILVELITKFYYLE